MYTSNTMRGARRSPKGRNVKPFWKSRTLWINVLSAIGLVLGERDIVPIDGESAALALAAVNIALRLLTKTAITAHATKPAPVEPAGV